MNSSNELHFRCYDPPPRWRARVVRCARSRAPGCPSPSVGHFLVQHGLTNRYPSPSSFQTMCGRCRPCSRNEMNDSIIISSILERRSSRSPTDINFFQISFFTNPIIKLLHCIQQVHHRVSEYGIR